ncbi:MAG: PH domain-containing protein [bacterium]
MTGIVLTTSFQIITIQEIFNRSNLILIISFAWLFISSFLAYFYQRWYFATYFYDLTDDFIQIKKGPITPQEITIPYERLQDVSVDQDLLDRLFGLYDVHVSSATISSEMDAHIDGVEKQSAEGLRAIFLETILKKITKNKTSDSLTNNSVS